MSDCDCGASSDPVFGMQHDPQCASIKGMRMQEPEIIVVPKGPSVIVIGPDGVGKTTVCARMSEMTGIPVWKCPSEKTIFRGGGANPKFMEGGSLVFDFQLAYLLSQTGYRIISDRGYPCERVYAQVFGRKTDDALLTAIDQSHAEHGTRILYLYSSVLPAWEDDLVPSARYWDVKSGYDQFAEWSGCDVLFYDTAEMLRVYQEGGDASREVALDCLRLVGEI